jgi:protein O-mannosyl-transferase
LLIQSLTPDSKFLFIPILSGIHTFAHLNHSSSLSASKRNMAGQKKTSGQKNKGKAVSSAAVAASELPLSAQAQGALQRRLAILVAGIALLLYAQSISFRYTLDDDTVLFNNELVSKGISSIPSILTHSYWYGFDKTDNATYRPASLILFAVEWQLFPGRPGVYHAVNALLYALTCGLLFLLLRRLFEKQNMAFALLCALLYAAHPLHTEVVNSIKSRDEILCFLFAVGAALLLQRYASKGSVAALLGGGLCFFLSMLSKETGITFLVVLPLLLFVFTAAPAKKMLAVAGVLAAFAAFYFLLRYQALEPGMVARSMTALDNTLAAAPDLMSRYATAFYILLRYFFLLIVPYPLSYDYSFAHIRIQGPGDAGALLGLALYAAAAIYALLAIRKKKIIAFCILFFLLTLAPASNLFVLIGSTMAERFLYIPSLGFCMALTWLLFKMTNDAGRRSVSVSHFIKTNRFVFVVSAAIIFLYSLQTVLRSRHWEDNVALFGHDVKVADRSARAHYNWGSSLLLDVYPKEKNKNKQNGILEKSIVEFQKAVSILPSYSDAHMNLGIAYMNKEDAMNAIASYEKAKRLYPRPTAKLYNNLGMLYGKTGKFNEALSVLDSAIMLEPGLAVAHNNRGQALYGLGRYDEAISEFQKAIDLKKDFAEGYRNLGGAYGSLKQYEKALEHLHRAEAISPADATILQFIGTTYRNLGDTAQARIYLEKAIRAQSESEQ